MEQDPQSWPPAPSNQAQQVPDQLESRWAIVIPLFCSILGAICLLIGSSSPSTKGLSGMAFERAFEANEDVMLWPFFGFPLALAGLITGLTHRRTRLGRVAVAVALLSVTWFFLRQ